MPSHVQQLSMTVSGILWMRKGESFNDGNRTVQIQQRRNTRQKTMFLLAMLLFSSCLEGRTEVCGCLGGHRHCGIK